MLWLWTLLLATASASTIKKRAIPDHGFSKLRPASPESDMRLHIAIAQHDSGAEIENLLLQTSDPQHEKFRQHLSAQEVLELSEPDGNCRDVVTEWLGGRGKDVGGGMLEFEGTVEEVEKLLNARYFVWSDGEKEVVRTDEFELPGGVEGCVDFLTPTTIFPRAGSKAAVLQQPHKRALGGSACGSNSNSTPDCIKKLYNITHTPLPNRTTFAIYATESASFSNTDLQSYLRKYNPSAAGATYQILTNTTQSPGGIEQKFETSLTTQTLLALAHPAQGILYNFGGVFGPESKVQDNFVTFLMELLTNQTIPNVISISESQPENRLDPQYAQRICNLMAAIGLRGTTLVFSSGNNGPSGDSPGGEHKFIFEPEFPASCPWILSIGGTTNPQDEEAATQKTIPFLSSFGFTASGGGFSNVFPAQSWQYPFVHSYITTHVPESYKTPSTGFPQPKNSIMRGIPDISALSTSFPTIVNGLEIPIGGTSAATPVWAAIITILNDYQLSRNRSTLGLVGPWLYEIAKKGRGGGLRDITKGGDNQGKCDFLQGCTLTLEGKKLVGYRVVEGWDAVTGLGSPNLGVLLGELDERAGG